MGAAIQVLAALGKVAATGPTLVNSVSGIGNTGGATTAGISTSGANLIVIYAGWYPGTTPDGVLSDSNLNTWVPLTITNTGNSAAGRMFYCFNPVVGAGHTFSYLGVAIYGTLCVEAWSGIATSPFDVQNVHDGGGSATSVTTNSITPSQANTVVFAGLMFEGTASGGTVAIDSGFTISSTAYYASGNNEGCSLAHKILTAATAQNPTWTQTTPGQMQASIASFKY